MKQFQKIFSFFFQTKTYSSMLNLYHHLSACQSSRFEMRFSTKIYFFEITKTNGTKTNKTITNDKFQKKIGSTKIRISKIFELREKNKCEKNFEIFLFQIWTIWKKIDSKIFARSFINENEITIRFLFVKQFSKKKFFSKTKRIKISTLKKFQRKKKITFSLNFRLWSIHDSISFLIFVKNCFCRVLARIRISFSIKIENCSRFVTILKRISFLIEINCFNSTFVLKNSSNSKIALFENTFCCFWSLVTKVSKRSFLTTSSRREKWFCFRMKNISKTTKNEFSFWNDSS